VSRLADGKQVDPAASGPEVDPCPGASDRMSGMEKCQTVKAGVLSRGRSHISKDMKSHVPKGMARGGKGTAARQIDGEARPVLQPGNFGRLCLGSGLKE
jgi:hypothetical protein